ncbi:MAG: Ig-like domain-containing protein [Eubacteriaceae bacterium]|nr:Ig-like domain-containing protein [Eubacteriaceae bacterium]
MKAKMYGKKVWMLTAMVLMVISLLTAGSLAVFAEQASDVVSPEAQDNQILLGEPSKQLEDSKAEDAKLKTQSATRYVVIPAEFDYDAARYMHTSINNERAKKGKTPLRVNREAVEFAMERAVEDQLCFEKHHSPRGYVRVGNDNSFGGENEAIGPSNNGTVESLQDGLIKSPGHYENMTNSEYRAMGTGYVRIGEVGTAIHVFSYRDQSGDDVLPNGKVSRTVSVYFEPSFCNIRTFFTDSKGVKVQSVGLKKGDSQTIQLSAYGTPSDSNLNMSFAYTPTKASFSSSNPNVAKVDSNGKITAISNGTAMITATTGTESNTIQVTVADNSQTVQYYDRITYYAPIIDKNHVNISTVEAGDTYTFSYDEDETYKAGSLTVKWTGLQTEIISVNHCTYKLFDITSSNGTARQSISIYPEKKQSEETPSSNESISYTFVCEQTGISQNVVCQDGKTATYAFEGNDDYGPFSCTMKWENKSSSFAKITDCLVSTDGVKSVNGSYVQTIKLTPKTVKSKSADFRVRVAYPNAVNETYTLQTGENRRITKSETEDYEALSFNLSWDGINYSVTNKNQCDVNITGNKTKGFDVEVTPVAKAKDNAVNYTVSYDGLTQKDTKTCDVGESVDFSISNNSDFEDLHFTLTWDGKTTTVSDCQNCEVTVGDFSNGNQLISVKPTAPKDKNITYHVIYEQLGMTKTAVCDVNQYAVFETDATEKYIASDFRLFWDGEKTNNFYKSNCEISWGEIYTVNGKKQQNVMVTLKERSVQPDTPDPVEDEQNVAYRTHVESVGWQPYVTNATMSGTSGRSLRLEGMNIKLVNKKFDGNIEYRTHIQNVGWETSWKKNDAFSGTNGQGLRLEAMQVRLTGEMANHYDIYYRVHAEGFGWLNWAKNGQPSGTEGYGYRLEGMQLMLVEKGKSVPNITPLSVQSDFYKKNNDPGFYIPNSNLDQVVEYTTHVQNVGWQPYMTNGMMAGTSGRSLRLEGLRIKLNNQKYNGTVLYRTHIQNIGWESTYRSGGSMSGTSGRSLRLEAMQISLTGEMANHYDIYYRVHAQNIGWLGWAKNGESAGTEGYGYRLEGMQIVLVEKGQDLYQLNPSRPKTAAFVSKQFDDLSLKTQ